MLLSLGVVVVGVILIAKHANSNSGSVLGWVLVAGGLFLALAALGYTLGAYSE